MSKTKDKQTYKKEREPRTHKRKIEEERIKEVKIPSRNQLAITEFLPTEGDAP